MLVADSGHSWKRNAVLWAALWSCVLTSFIYVFVRASNLCFFIVSPAGVIRLVFALIWFWLLLFLFFGKRGRLILTAATALVALALATVNVDTMPIAAGEATAVGRLKSLADAMETYRKEHPREGFPQRMPLVSSAGYGTDPEKLYKFELTVSRSKPDGPIDGFVIQATPVWRECGYIRSFAASDDALIRFTIEDRSATRTDATIK